MKCTVNVSETLSTNVVIDAHSRSEAMRKAREMYKNSEILVTADNFETLNMSINTAEFIKENYKEINQAKILKTPLGFEEIYFNPDSSAGGQLVYNKYPYALIREASKTGNVEDFFQYLNDNCTQYSVDVDNENFLDYAEDFITKQADYSKSDKETAYAMIIFTNEHFETRKEEK